MSGARVSALIADGCRAKPTAEGLKKFFIRRRSSLLKTRIVVFDNVGSPDFSRPDMFFKILACSHQSMEKYVGFVEFARLLGRLQEIPGKMDKNPLYR